MGAPFDPFRAAHGVRTSGFGIYAVESVDRAGVWRGVHFGRMATAALGALLRRSALTTVTRAPATSAVRRLVLVGGARSRLCSGTTASYLDKETYIATLQREVREAHREGRLHEAEDAARAAADASAKHFGETHPVTASALNNVALCLKAKGDLDGAVELYREVVDVYEKALGTAEHPSVATAMQNLGVALKEAADEATGMDKVATANEARGWLERALELRKKSLDADDPIVAVSMFTLAAACRIERQNEEAERLLLEALRILREGGKVSPDHPVIGTALNNLGYHYRCNDQWEQAKPMYEEALQIREA